MRNKKIVPATQNSNFKDPIAIYKAMNYKTNASAVCACTSIFASIATAITRMLPIGREKKRTQIGKATSASKMADELPSSCR
jgi:hypothetical protein